MLDMDVLKTSARRFFGVKINATLADLMAYGIRTLRLCIYLCVQTDTRAFCDRIHVHVVCNGGRNFPPEFVTPRLYACVLNLYNITLAIIRIRRSPAATCFVKQLNRCGQAPQYQPNRTAGLQHNV